MDRYQAERRPVEIYITAFIVGAMIGGGLGGMYRMRLSRRGKAAQEVDDGESKSPKPRAW